LSLLLAKLISVENRDSAFLIMGFSALAGLNCFLMEVISLKRKDKAFFPGQPWSHIGFFVLLVSTFGSTVVIFVTVVTPHFGYMFLFSSTPTLLVREFYYPLLLSELVNLCVKSCLDSHVV
jgi:hypothetical protein